jgi:hypothetical protein
LLDCEFERPVLSEGIKYGVPDLGLANMTFVEDIPRQRLVVTPVAKPPAGPAVLGDTS